MSVVAKFRVNSVENIETYDEKASNSKVKLRAIYVTEDDPTASEEDLSFSIATPQGSIEMLVTNPDALEQFQLSDEFYVRFERVPKKTE